MILSVSRRTDIPCYYSEWFINRLRAGYVLTRNPMNHAQLSRIPLTPEIVDCIVFWTKDAKNITPYLNTIDKMGYKYYFLFTLNPYDKSVEKNLRDKNEIEETFIELSKQIGKERVLWRYDPIIINDVLTVEYHKEKFERLCTRLSPYTKSVTISFVDIYAKLKTTLIREITESEIIELSCFIGKTALNYDLTPKACCEIDLLKYGIQKASCIDKNLTEEICGQMLDIKADKNQRTGCGCIESIDIGTYNTCLSGCIFCYANNNPATTVKRFNSHNKNSELLIGTMKDGEKITERTVKSYKQDQIQLFNKE